MQRNRSLSIGWVADNTSLSKTTNQVIHLIRSLQRSYQRCEHSVVPNWPFNSAQQVKCKGNEDKNATNVGAWRWENSRMEQCLLCMDTDMAVPIYCSGFTTLYNSICSGSDPHNSEKSCSPVHAVWFCQVKLFPNIIQALSAIITVTYLLPIPKTEFCFAFFSPPGQSVPAPELTFLLQQNPNTWKWLVIKGTRLSLMRFWFWDYIPALSLWSGLISIAIMS